MTAKKTKTKTNKQYKKKGKKGLEYRTKKWPISRHWQIECHRQRVKKNHTEQGYTV